MSDLATNPVVTICIPTYNAAATLAETLTSIQNQSYRDIKIKVVDNSSSDETVNIAKGFAAADNRILVLCHDENVGAEGNFTRCLQLADGPYTAIYHADDLYEPHMVSKQVAFLETHPDAAVVFSLAKLISSSGEERGVSKMPSLLVETNSEDMTFGFPEVFNAILKEHNFFICPSAMARSTVYREHVAIWDGDQFGSSADLGVWLRILEKHRAGIIPEYLMRYRLSPAQGSIVLNRLRTKPADFFRVMDHYLSCEWVKEIVNPGNLACFRIHEARDMLKRARSALILGDQTLAKSLSRDAWKMTSLTVSPWKMDARVCKLVLKTWFAGLFVYLVSRFPLQRAFARLFFYLKYERRAKRM